MPYFVLLFLFFGKPGSKPVTPLPAKSGGWPGHLAANKTRGATWPHEFARRSALREATPGTRPPAAPTLGRRPQPVLVIQCTEKTPAKDLSSTHESIKKHSFEQPRKASQGLMPRASMKPRVAAQGGLCPRITPSTMHPRGMWMRVANPLPGHASQQVATSLWQLGSPTLYV